MSTTASTPTPTASRDAGGSAAGLVRPTRRWVRVILAGAMLATTITFLLTPLNGNLRYEVGVKIVAPFSAADTFSHRPLAFRLLLGSLASLADGLSFGLSSFELVLRGLLLALAVGAGLLAWRGLRSAGVDGPGALAVVAVASIVFSGAGSAGEPDWVTAVLAVGGGGAALLGCRHRRWTMAGVSALLLVAAAGMKIVTLPTALLALLVVAALDRRQAWRVVVSCLVVGTLYVVATLIWVPWELTWLFDIRAVQQSPTGRLLAGGLFFLTSAARWPAVALLPAALILLRPRPRVLLLLALALAVAPLVAQGVYFTYHAVPLCVVSAVAVYYGLEGRVPAAVGTAELLVVAAASALTAVPAGWRSTHVSLWGTVTLLIAAVAVVWAVIVRQPSLALGRRPWAWSVRGGVPIMALALLYPAMTPYASRLVMPTSHGRTLMSSLEVTAHKEDTARRIRQRIGGSDVPVTYLTFGEWTYFLRNPTVCRFPSPLFLQRSSVSSGGNHTPSFRENLACVAEPSSRWLILDPVWFPLRRTTPEVQEAVASTWNCGAGFRVRELVVCPRRN